MGMELGCGQLQHSIKRMGGEGVPFKGLVDLEGSFREQNDALSGKTSWKSMTE